MSRVLGALFALLACALSAAADQALFEEGSAAYRRGDHGTAIERWSELLSEPLAPPQRAQVLYNLGNAAWRDGRGGEALGWYAACLRQAPRHADARHNIAFVREELGLTPEETGDLKTAFARFAGSTTRDEAAWLVVGALGLLLAALMLEALRGGALWRMVALGAGAGVLLTLVPWIHAETRGGPEVLAVGVPRTQLRAEPRDDLPAVSALEAGQAAARIDALPGWVRVETADGERGWARSELLFALER